MSNFYAALFHMFGAASTRDDLLPTDSLNIIHFFAGAKVARISVLSPRNSTNSRGSQQRYSNLESIRVPE